MKKYLSLLIFLLSSLTITGVSLIDGKVWDLIIVWFGVIAYEIVGVMYSLKLISGRNGGIRALKFIMILLVLIGIMVYIWLQKFQVWILTWPLIFKILVPTVIGLLTILVFILTVVHWDDEDIYN